jgi:hypothetical protein
MTKACPVIKTFQSWLFPRRIPFPGSANSIRITNDIMVPTTAEKVPKIIYRVPISLWLVENNQRDAHP